MNALTLHNLCYSYYTDWTRSKVQVLHDVSLDIRAGETFGFLGHNGAGKTTTIKCILGLCHPSSGIITVFDKDIREARNRSTLGYLPEQPYFYDNLTVFESLTAYGALSGLSGSALSERVEELLHIVQLTVKRNARMRSLSKGLMQRVGMAQAIINKPSLLILDEPFSGLDPVGRKEFREIIMGLKRAGTTIFMSSHVLSDVELLCDRASILVKGSLKGIFSMRDLIAEQPSRFEIAIRNGKGLETLPSQIALLTPHLSITQSESHILVTTASYAEACSVLAEVMKQGGEILHFQSERKTLEDIFMSAVQGGA